MPRIPEEWIERLKTDVSVPLLAERAGVELRRVGQELVGRCPASLHESEDTTPSLSVNEEKNVFQCFGCGVAGTPIDWVMKEKGLDFRGAVEELLWEFFPAAAQELLGEKRERKTSRRMKAPRLPCPFGLEANDQAILDAYAEHCHELFNGSARAQEYARKRGLDSSEMAGAFRFGYEDGSLGQRVPEGHELRERLKNLGLLRESGRAHLAGCLLIPAISASGNVTGIYGRKTDDGPGTKHLYSAGKDADVFNDAVFVGSKEIVLCESRIDALSFWQHEIRNVTACRGAGNLSEALLAAFVRHGIERCYIAFDHDEAGEKGAAKAAKKLLAAGIECYRVRFPKGMDANEVSRVQTPARKHLELYLRSAEAMGDGSRAKASEPVPVVTPASSGEVNAAPLEAAEGTNALEDVAVSSSVALTAPVESLAEDASEPLPEPPGATEEDASRRACTLEESAITREAASAAVELPVHDSSPALAGTSEATEEGGSGTEGNGVPGGEEIRAAEERSSIAAVSTSNAPAPRAALRVPPPAPPVLVVTGRAPRTELFSRVVEHYHGELGRNQQAQEFLDFRGLRTRALWRAQKLGYASGSLEALAGHGEDNPVWRGLVSMGILSEAGEDTMKGRVVFPLFAFNQLPVNLYGHAVTKALEPERFLPGKRRGLFNQNAGRRSRELIIVESVIGAASFVESGVQNAIPLHGADGFGEEHREIVRRFAVASVVVALGGEERHAVPGIRAAFEELGVRVRAIEWPGKDVNETLVRHGPRKTREILEGLLSAPKPRDLPKAPDVRDLPKPAERAAGVVAAGAADVQEEARGSEGERSMQAPRMPEPPVKALDVPGSTRTAPATIHSSDEGSHPEIPALSGDLPSMAEFLDVPAVESVADGSRLEEAPSFDITPVTPHPSSPLPKEPAHEAPIPLTKEQLLSESLAFTSDGRLYRVVWTQGCSLSHLRATVRVRVDHPPGLGDAARALEPPSFIDSVDLVLARARESFAKRAARAVSGARQAAGMPLTDEAQLALQRAMEADLIRLADTGEERRKAIETRDAVPLVMSEIDKKRALRFLASPTLLVIITRHMDAIGYVGEDTNKTIGYLVGISRKLDVPLSMVILSPSGSGKSGLADALEALTPEEEFVSLSSITAQALYYMPKDKLKRKFILIEERAGSIEADYSIRALQSKKKLTRAVPIKDPATGKIETKIFEILGPAAFLETTTESRINVENATRCFEIHLDESQEQTERIQKAQRHAKTFLGLWAKEEKDAIVHLHHDAQRLLRTVSVVIPYADAIEFPTAWLRTRRDNLRFLHLIEVLAFLHQYQRPLVHKRTVAPFGKKLEDVTEEELGNAVVIATLADYAAAYELAGGLLGETLLDLKKPERSFLDLIRSDMERLEEKGQVADFSRREMRELSGLPQHRIRELFETLLELEYIEPVRSSRGAGVRYRLTQAAMLPQHTIPGLLTPEALAKKLEAMKKERQRRKAEGGPSPAAAAQ